MFAIHGLHDVQKDSLLLLQVLILNSIMMLCSRSTWGCNQRYCSMYGISNKILRCYIHHHLPVPMKSDNRGSPPILHCIVVATTRMISVKVNEAFAKLLRRATSLIKQSLSKVQHVCVCNHLPVKSRI